MESLRIFVSFQVEDRPLAARIKEFINEVPYMRAFSVNLLDLLDDRAGNKVLNPALLYKTLSNPDAALVVLSQNYLSDPWFYHELPALFVLEQALKSDWLIPVLVDNVSNEQIPHYLRDRPALDFRSANFNETLPRLIGALEQRRQKRASEVFIVHGHGNLRDVVARFIERLGLTPVILEEQVSASSTIIEKLERNRNVGYAVIVLTPDDVGAAREDSSGLQPRPRQNVIFEMGFFMGILERHRVCALLSGFSGPPVEFSDFAGITYISMDRGNWETQLARELRAQGFIFDFDRFL